MLNRFLLSMLVACLLVSCGDDSSGSSSTQPVNDDSANEELSSDSEVRSSSGDALSSAKVKRSSSSEAEPESSDDAVLSSSEDLQSSPDEKKSSSSSAKSSSSNNSSSESQSSTEPVANSNSGIKEESSSSEKSSSSGEEISSSTSSNSENVSSSSQKDASSSSTENTTSGSAESSSSLGGTSSSVRSSTSVIPAAMSIYDAENNTLTDLRDNNAYKTVIIGEQIWMAENLNYKYKDESKSVCYNDSAKYCDSYGRLYVKEIKDIVCPDKWHLPDSLEWEKIIQIAGEKNGPLKADSSWAPWQNKETNGTNETGFSALAAGMRTALGSGYGEINRKARFWMAGKINRHVAIDIFNDDAPDYLFTSDGVPAYSIRCLKDLE